jgi:hypothetical protein
MNALNPQQGNNTSIQIGCIDNFQNVADNRETAKVVKSLQSLFPDPIVAVKKEKGEKKAKEAEGSSEKNDVKMAAEDEKKVIN